MAITPQAFKPTLPSEFSQKKPGEISEWGFWRGVYEQYRSEGLLELYLGKHPEKSEFFGRIETEYGADAAAEVLMETFAKPAEAGFGDLRQQEQVPSSQPVWRTDPTTLPVAKQLELAKQTPQGKRLAIETFAPMQRKSEVQSALSKVPEGVDPEQYWRAVLGTKYYPESEIDGLIGMFKNGVVPEIMLSGDTNDTPEWEAPYKPKDTLSGAKVLAQSLIRVPSLYAARILTWGQGYHGASVTDKGWADNWIGKRRKNHAAFVNKIAKEHKSKKFLPKIGPFPAIKLRDLAMFADNLAFSGAAVTGGVPVALGATALTTPVGGAIAGVAATSAVAFQMSSYEIMQSFLEMKDAEKRELTGKGLTRAEEIALKKGFETKAIKYGLWEAIPEALAAGAWAFHLTRPLTLMTGSKSTAMKIIAGTGKGLGTFGVMLAEETGTEMFTQMGQQATLVGTGMPEAKDVSWTNAGDWIDAFHAVAPQTFMLTAFLGGLGGGARVVGGRIVSATSKQAINQLIEEVGEQDPYFEPLKEKIEAAAKGDKQVMKDMIDVTSVRPELISEGALQIPSLEEGDRVGMRPTGALGTILSVSDTGYEVQMDNGMKVKAPQGKFWRHSRPDFGTRQDVRGIEQEQISDTMTLEEVPIAEEPGLAPVEATLPPAEEGEITVAPVEEPAIPPEAPVVPPVEEAALPATVPPEAPPTVPEPPLVTQESTAAPDSSLDLDRWITEENQKRAAEREEAGQKGAVDLSREEALPVPEDPDINAALNAWRDTSGWMGRTAKSLRGGLVRMKDFATAEQDPQIRRAGFVQFQDDVRTGFIPVLPRARHKWLASKHAIYGNLNRRQKQSFLHLLALRDMNENQQRGIPVVGPDGKEVPAVQKELQRIEGELREKAPEVLEAAQRYREFSLIVAKDLVERKELTPESVRTDYFPIFNLEYLPEWWELAPFAKRAAEEPFRRYTMQRRGRSRRIAYNETALDVHFTSVFADNMMEDWSLEQLHRYDISGGLTPEERAEVFGVNQDTKKTLRPKHRKPYKYKGKDYVGVRYEKSKARWGYEANLDLLEEALEDAALDVDRLLTKGREFDINKLLQEGASERIDEVISRSPKEQQEMLRSYLLDVGPRGGDAIRRALILGRHVKTYVVPKVIGEKLLQLHSPLGIRWLRPFMQATSLWKGATLGPFAASLPFMANQVIGDGANTLRNNIKALSPANLGSAIKIIANAYPEESGWMKKVPGLRKLSPTQERSRQISHDKDVFGSAFFHELRYLNRVVERLLKNKPATDVVNYVLSTWMRSNVFRELILRVAVVHENVKRDQQGLPVWMPEYKQLQPGLDTDSQIGLTGRRVNVDYLATPEYYNNFIRGLAFPFATFYQKSGTNWAQYIRNAPARFFAKFVVPYVASDVYNHERYPDTEALLPEWIRSRFHIIINEWDDNKDDVPDRARVFAPQLPLDMAIGMSGLHTFRSKIPMMLMKDAQGNPVMTPKEAAMEQLREMWGAKFDVPTQLVNPMIQAFIGITANRDSFTKRRIVPKGMEGMPDEQQWRDYKFPYILEKMVTPIGQYMRSTRGDDKVFGPIPALEDIPSGLSRYARQTFNPLRGFGIYEINLHRQRANQLMQPTFEAENIANVQVGKIIADYIGSGQTPDEYISSESFARKVENANEAGVLLASKDYADPQAYIYSRITKPWVQLDRLGRERRLATTEKEKRRIDEELESWTYKLAQEVMSGTDLKAQPEWAKRFIKLMDTNPWKKPKE